MARRPAATPGTETKVALPVFGGQARQCGSCQECCTVVEAKPLGKPEHQRCQHLKARNSTRCCSLGDEVLPGCKLFTCLWLGGMGKNRDRPDRLGVVFVLEDDGAGRLIHMLRESRKDASKDQRVEEYARMLVKEHKDRPVVAAFKNHRRVLYYPAERMSELDVAIANQDPALVDSPRP